MLAEFRPALIITRREVRDQFRDWRIIVPIVGLTIFFPALMNFTAAQAINFVQQYGADLVGERLIPFLLMVVGFFPTSIALVIALESFVGEKERRSIEPLLSSPLSDGQLYVGKLLASMVPPLVAAYLGIMVYLVGLNRQIGYQPEPVLLIQILLLTTVHAVVMVSGAVVISTQTTSARAANLLASFVIIPMALLIQAESMIMFWGRYVVLWLMIVAMMTIAALLIRTGVAHFNREELLGRELDTLNVHWMGVTFRDSFIGSAKSRLGWLTSLFRDLPRQLSIPVLATSLSLIAALGIGYYLAGRFVIPINNLKVDSLQDGVVQGLEALPIYSVGGVFTVWLHNLRALMLATLLGIFSFGALGLLVIMLPLVIIGYFMAVLTGIGIAPLMFLGAFVLPHGIVEIPAMIIAGAAILRLGATLAAPAPGKTIGAAFLDALASWTKVFFIVVAPMLLLAAVLEVYLTPTIVARFFGG
jgi:uncharacterized membrane protein SpoIIM required for sporulation